MLKLHHCIPNYVKSNKVLQTDVKKLL